MPRIDLTLPELRDYRPQVREPADFDEFWAATIAEARSIGGDLRAVRVDSPLRTVDVFDVTFPGFAGDPIKAWLVQPAGADGPLPAVVEFNGYGGGRGLPSEHLAWASAGYVVRHYRREILISGLKEGQNSSLGVNGRQVLQALSDISHIEVESGRQIKDEV